eukprot:5599528-Prorocentrum_lima.AAC.1
MGKFWRSTSTLGTEAVSLGLPRQSFPDRLQELSSAVHHVVRIAWQLLASCIPQMVAQGQAEPIAWYGVL